MQIIRKMNLQNLWLMNWEIYLNLMKMRIVMRLNRITHLLQKFPLPLKKTYLTSWDEAENAFMGFDKDSLSSEDEDWTKKRSGTEKSFGKDYSSYEEGRYSFNEDELKDIVTNSVQNALEKSIASSLVELAVSEIKNNVSGRV